MRLPSVLAALALVAVPASPAAAQPFLMTGSGTISPGLTPIPAPQSVSFSGTATVPAGGTYSCSFGGTETGSVAVSVGNWGGGCGPFQCPDWIATRVGSWQELTCSVAQVGSLPLNLTCLWVPIDTNPVRHFSLICA